ncbi:MAG: hypothetical protein V1882_03895 [Candidatus Omnitrophota bacterium]
MRKIIGLALAASFLFSIAAFAEELKIEEMPGGPMPGMGKMCAAMMGGSQMVATDEGGVIVLAGNKLMKYDADLNIVKEVDVKMPSSPMMGMQCPMRGKMAKQDSGPAQEAPGKNA